jgi:hypothetical protein
MPQKSPSLIWISDGDQRRFLVIDEFAVAAEDSLVPLTSLDRAGRSFRKAAAIVEALIGILLADFLFADQTRICVLPARDDSLLPDERSLPESVLPLLPGVQAWVDAWRLSITEPSKAHEAALAKRKHKFDPMTLVRLKAAIEAIANSSPQGLVFGDMKGKRITLSIPPKQQLRRVNPRAPKSKPARLKIAAISHVSNLINASGSVHSLPTSGLSTDVRSGVTVKLLKAKPAAPMSWRVAARVIRVTRKRKS